MKPINFYRMSVFEGMFLIENITIAIFAGSNIEVKPFVDPGKKAVIFSLLIGLNIFGIILKVVYYKFLHIWKDVTTRFDKSTGTFKRNKEDLSFQESLCCFKKENNDESLDMELQ